MKKFKSVIPDGGLKFFNKFLESELGAELWQAMESIIAHTSESVEGIVLTGGTVAGVTGAATITESIVALNGKILRLPADTALSYPFYIAEAATLDIIEDYQDGVSRATIDNEFAECVPAIPGSGQYITISAVGEYKTGLPSFGTIEDEGNLHLKCKVVEIGDWNMDTTATVNVPVSGWGASDYKRIRQVKAVIRNDGDATYYDIDTNIGGTRAGAIDRINTSVGYVIVSRITGGSFDNASFTSIGFNRGWMTIWYV